MKSNYPDLFVLRHGQTEWNVQGRYQGHLDSPLTALGHEQARAQNTILRSLPNLPSAAFHSPQGRAELTAGHALKGLCVSTADDRLKEINFGDWEGRTRAEVHAIASGSDTQTHVNFRSPNGETYEMIRARVDSFLNMLTKPTIIVTHGTTSSILRGAVMGLSIDDLLALPLEQGCVFQLSGGIETILRKEPKQSV